MQERFANMDDFISYVIQYFPLAQVDEDNDGQLIIYTGLTNDGENGVIPTEETY